MTLSNEYPLGTIHKDIDRIVKSWKNELYPVLLSRNRSTKTITITFSERRRTLRAEI